MWKDKTVIFLGSSVTYGSAAGGISFAELIAERTGCTMIKEAVSGTTLADLDESSYVSRMKTIQTEKADLLVCQLSTNDATRGLPLGEITAEEADEKTVVGAINAIVRYAKETWNCPVAFYTNPRYESDAYEKMVAALLALAPELGVAVVDLWNDSAFNAITEEQRAVWMADAIHPTLAGYREWWTPVIEAKLAAVL